MATRIMPARVTEILRGSPEFSTFNQLLRRSHVIAEIDTDDQLTVFAPANEAFEKMPPNSLGALIADPAALHEAVLFHVIAGAYPEVALRAESSVMTLAGIHLLVEKMDYRTYVGGALITEGDIEAENGFVHVVDTPLFPG
jgi:uncharacterized surface protein with fasciclin (FAS1) repeats